MQVKGSAIETIPLFIRKQFGEESYKRWLASLPDTTRKEFESFLLASKWYPLKEMLVDPTVVFCKMFYHDDPSGAVELGRFSAEYGLRGIYKIFVRIGSPNYLVSRAVTILPTFYDNVEMDLIDRSDRKVTVRIIKFDGIHTLVEHRIKGWMERALEISGAKSVKVVITKAISQGDPTTNYVGVWE